jgi:hypothetical protein
MKDAIFVRNVTRLESGAIQIRVERPPSLSRFTQYRLIADSYEELLTDSSIHYLHVIQVHTLNDDFPLFL